MFELNKIYNEDCLETLKNIPDNFLDLIITSPPYNLGNNHHTGNKKVFAYDDNMPEREYQNWQIKILNELFRTTKDSGSLIYNHKNRIKNGIQISPYSWIFKTKWIVKQEIVWFNGSQNFDKIRFYPMTERFYWLAKSPSTKLFNSINHHDLFGKDEWKAEGTNKEHKRSFPEKMVEDFLNCFPDSRIIYDPFLGCGTVAKICKRLGKSFIGSEISKEYFDLAMKNIT
jgi:site-specific DNA-methyltransferase (adenine-specific)